MSSLLLALQFLTILPVRIKEFSLKKNAWALAYFPAVGLFLGLLLVGLDYLLFGLGLNRLTVNIFLVVSLILFTGGMHLDGLTDTADAFFSARGREDMLKIMRDPHIGVMGVLALVSCILLKITLLLSVSLAVKPVVLLLMCILSRWSAVEMMYLFPYAREEGKAKSFMQGLSSKIFISALVLVLALALICGHLKGLFALAIVAGFTYLIGKASTIRINGITGDVLGATIEINELVILFLFCLKW